MPILVFCEECGARQILDRETIDEASIQIPCPACGDIIVLHAEDIEVLTSDSKAPPPKK